MHGAADSKSFAPCLSTTLCIPKSSSVRLHSCPCFYCWRYFCVLPYLLLLLMYSELLHEQYPLPIHLVGSLVGTIVWQVGRPCLSVSLSLSWICEENLLISPSSYFELPCFFSSLFSFFFFLFFFSIITSDLFFSPHFFFIFFIFKKNGKPYQPSMISQNASSAGISLNTCS